MSTQMTIEEESSGTDYELDHEVDEDAADTTELANLQQREQNRYELQELARRTVEPGLLKLKVASVTLSDSGNMYAINIAHPMQEDTIPIYAEKPEMGWSDDYKIVRMLKWVGEESTKDPHALEFHDLYLRNDSDSSENPHDWYVVKPPEYTKPLKEQIPELYRSLKSYRPNMTNAKMYGFLLAGAISGVLMENAVSFGFGAIESIGIMAIMFSAFTIAGMVVLDK